MKKTYDIPIEELLGKAESVYKLVHLAARRAIELTSGAGKLIEASPTIKISTLALEEIRQGKVRLKKRDKKEEKAKK